MRQGGRRMGNGSYEKLERRFARIADLNAASRTVRWYSLTYGPPGGEAARGHQQATLGGLAHELLTAPDCAEALAAARTDEPWQAANLREMRRLYGAAAALPTDLVEAKARAVSRAQGVWHRTRAQGDFAAFLPALREVVARVREEAGIRGEALGLAPYDALLDSYDPGRRGEGVAAMFAELEAFLPGVIDRVRGGPKPPGPEGPRADLERLARRLMAMLGLEERHVRLDESAHPFSTGEKDDVRITTRYSGPPGEALMAVLHESGHALYTRGLPEDWRRQPVGRNRGMTAHESQSLSIEMQACRSEAFAVPYARLLNEELAPADEWEPARLCRVLNHVEPGPIRVEADEVSYPLHIIVRHRCETALISGALDPADLPDAFDDAMDSLLGIRPPGPREGCMQDIHWSGGSFGYFPTYTLGALMAAQLAEAMREALPGLDREIERGDFRPLTGWLREHVHSRGCLDASSDDLTEQATGRPLDTGAFIRHIGTRYSG